MVVSVTDTKDAYSPFFIFWASWASLSRRIFSTDSPNAYTGLLRRATLKTKLGKEIILLYMPRHVN